MATTYNVHEAKTHLSQLLERVQNGESLRVTDRGRVVALLSPLASEATALATLIAAGRATPAAGSLTDLGPPAGTPSRVLSRLLARMRDEERY